MITIIYANEATPGETPKRIGWYQRVPFGWGDHLAVDPMPHYRGPFCAELGELHGYRCTRPPQHTRRHAASTGRRIVAVWP